MIGYSLRRLAQSSLTVFGVMVLTFLLFRVVVGDIAAAHKGEKATEAAKADWRHQHGYDRPMLLNVHRQLELTDHTTGESYLRVDDGPKSRLTGDLALIPSDESLAVRLGRFVWGLDRETRIAGLLPDPPKKKRKKTQAKIDAEAKAPATMVVMCSNGDKFTVDIKPARTAGELIDLINAAEGNQDPATGKPKVEARISDFRWGKVLDSQFVDHLTKSVTFRAVSLVHKEKLTSIIAQRAPKSLALTIPAMALSWVLAMIISSVVAYYRGTMIDKVGVFVSVLGMCIPFLAWMIYGQWGMFSTDVTAQYAYGLENRANIYVPILIMTVASLGGSVRFYRTVILDETNRDYVRTARAKGVPLVGVLFKHVLRNCMLPILTNLVMAIPFLIMGSLVVESYFGIPGLGDLMLSSINARDEPVISGMVFLTSVIYTVGILLTDLSYAVFDPRVRLR